MAIKFVDRVPTRPGRIKITPENGTAPWYGVMERADEPSVEGTPINAANLNAMQENQGISSNLTLYVATSGSDSLGNGSSSAPYASISKALSVIPKQLNGYTVVINISSGVYNENVTIVGFNSGYVRLTGNVGETVSMLGLAISNSRQVEITNIHINISGGFINISDGTIMRAYAPITVNGGDYGIYTANGAIAIFTAEVVVNNAKNNAAIATNNSRLYVFSISGSNNQGAFASTGGSVVAFGTSTLAAVIQYYTLYGGRIYSGAQTNIPNY